MAPPIMFKSLAPMVKRNLPSKMATQKPLLVFKVSDRFRSNAVENFRYAIENLQKFHILLVTEWFDLAGLLFQPSIFVHLLLNNFCCFS